MYALSPGLQRSFSLCFSFAKKEENSTWACVGGVGGGERVRNWEKARERNNTCCNYSTKSRFNGCADVYMNEFCVYIITPKCSTWWVDWMAGLQDSENAANGLLDSVKLQKRMQSYSGFLKELKVQDLDLTICLIIILAYTIKNHIITENVPFH